MLKDALWMALALVLAVWALLALAGHKEPLLPSTMQTEIVIQRRIVVGLGVKCVEANNLTVCTCGP